MLRLLHRSALEHNRQTLGKAAAQIVLRTVQLRDCRASLYQQVATKPGTASTGAESQIRREAAANARGIIKLNIGGFKYTTSLATLTAVPGTYFTALFGGKLTDILTQDGEVFIDRQGKCFEHILQYLRMERHDQAFQLPESLQRDELAALATEAEFYSFASFHDTLCDALREPPPQFRHKFLYKEYNISWEEHGKHVQALIRQGWELHETSLSCSMGNHMGLTHLRMQEY